MKRQTTIYISITLLAAIAFAVCTATLFPNTYRSMEEDNLWLMTMEYWNIKLAMAPAITNWLSDLLLQYYHTPGTAASIQALLLVAVSLLAERWTTRIIGSHDLLYWLGLLPAFVLGYCYTFDTCIIMQAIFFFAILLAYSSIQKVRARVIFGYVMAVTGYMLMSMPVLAVMVVVMMLEERFAFHTYIWRVQLPAIAILYFIPIVYSAQVAFIPFDERYTYTGAHFIPLTNGTNRYGERIRSYIHLAEDGRWTELLNKAHCRTEAYKGDPVALRFALLAECALGSMPENLLDYPIRDESQFFFPHEREYVTLQFNRLFYHNLGVCDESFHHTQEYGLQQKNGCCFLSLRHMAEYSIAEGEWEMAEKFLTILGKSLTHKTYISEKRKEMAEAKKRRQAMPPIPLRADNFVGGYSVPQEMLRLARHYTDPGQRKKMVDYAICSYLLRGDMTSFSIAVRTSGLYNAQNLPRAYRIAWERGHSQQEQE